MYVVLAYWGIQSYRVYSLGSRVQSADKGGLCYSAFLDILPLLKHKLLPSSLCRFTVEPLFRYPLHAGSLKKVSITFACCLTGAFLIRRCLPTGVAS